MLRLDKVFRTGVYDGGNLVRRDLCLSWYLDTYIFNLLRFTADCCYTLNRCMELYYICASSVFGKKKKKIQNALGSLMECCGAVQERLLACLPTSTTQQHTSTATVLIPGTAERCRQREFAGRRRACSYIILDALSKSRAIIVKLLSLLCPLSLSSFHHKPDRHWC